MAKQETNFNWRDFKGTPGEWRVGNNFSNIITDYKTERPTYTEESYESEKKYYGGYLVCESVSKKIDAKLIAAAPQMHQLLNEFICQGMKDKPNQESVFEITAKAQQLLIDIND
ncbi:MAG: hypothetical protein V3V28_09065 [Polaribacter sp.]|uniref:hypothetical protein n=1 Tax=Polaribacter sp. TaxID=1920175 RepID=UPI002F350E4D